MQKKSQEIPDFCIYFTERLDPLLNKYSTEQCRPTVYIVIKTLFSNSRTAIDHN